MGAENFTDFALSALASSINSVQTTLTVTAGQGALFPSANFVIAIDTELLFVGARSTDTLSSLTRGFNGTSAASHASGATLVLSASSYNFQHLWQNVADTYVPATPPAQVATSPSSYDNEFETTGSWTLFPAASGSTIFDVGTSIKSHLHFHRDGGSTLYTAYVPFATAATSYVVSTRLSEAVDFSAGSYASSDNTVLHFFVSNQSNPTTGPTVGNNFRVKLTTFPAPVGGTFPPGFRSIRSANTISGVSTDLGSSLPLSPSSPVYLRLVYQSGTWYGQVGDGITYWTLTSTVQSLTPQSLGFWFQMNQTSAWAPHEVAIDSVRYSTPTLTPGSSAYGYPVHV